MPKGREWTPHQTTLQEKYILYQIEKTTSFAFSDKIHKTRTLLNIGKKLKAQT